MSTVSTSPATEWAMNTSQLEAGMLVRRPGLNEELEVASVKDGKAKIKLPGGKTTTVAATMAIEFRWPEENAKATVKPEKSAKKSPPVSSPAPEPEISDTEEGFWLSDWSLLAAGQTIKVLGETAEFNVLRVTDSSARIKNNTSAQISGLSIGHKFQIVKEPATAPASEAKGKAGVRSRDRSRKAVPAPAPETETEDDGTQADLDFDPDTDTDEADEIPADIKAEIDHELNGGSEEEDEEAEKLEEDDEDETETDDTDHDEDEEEDRSMPPTTKPRGSAKSTKSPDPAPDSEWITVQQLSDALGCKPPRINTLRMKSKLPKGSWKQDPNDSRRLLYHSSLVEKLKDLAHGKRGGGKKSAARANQTEFTRPRRDGKKAGRPRKQADPVDGPATLATVFPKPLSPSPANAGLTLDAQLAAAIEHASAQILGLQNLVANLETQREQLRMWS